jgi:glycosyltransferase involved in cell wall biosynthesis
MKKKKIIYDLSIKGATRAGAYVFALNLFNALKSLDTQSYIIAFNNPFSTVNKKGLYRKIHSLLRLLFSESIYFKGGRDDFFIFPAPEVPLSMIFSTKKYAVAIHDLYAWKNRTDTTFFARLRFKILPILISKAEMILTISEFSKKEIIEIFNVDEKKIQIVKIGLDPIYLISDTRKFLPSNLSETNYLLNVGTLEPRKNIEFLIEIFEEVRNTLHPSINGLKLVLTGGESWNNEIIFDKINKSKYKNDIIILGSVDNSLLPSLYKNALAMVFPSKAEGFGIPVIEALSQGTPVFIQNNTALSEFSPYGTIVLDDFGVATWVDKMIDIIDKKYRVNSEYISQVKYQFNWENSALRLIDKLYSFIL